MRRRGTRSDDDARSRPPIEHLETSALVNLCSCAMTRCTSARQSAHCSNDCRRRCGFSCAVLVSDDEDVLTAVRPILRRIATFTDRPERTVPFFGDHPCNEKFGACGPRDLVTNNVVRSIKSPDEPGSQTDCPQRVARVRDRSLPSVGGIRSEPDVPCRIADKVRLRWGLISGCRWSRPARRLGRLDRELAPWW